MDPRERLSHRAADIFLNGREPTISAALARARHEDPAFSEQVERLYDPFGISLGVRLAERHLLDRPAPVSFGVRSPNTAPGRQYGYGVDVPVPPRGTQPPDVTQERDLLADVEEFARWVRIEMAAGYDYQQARDRVRAERPALDGRVREYYARGAMGSAELSELLARRRARPHTFEDRILGR